MRTAVTRGLDAAAAVAAGDETRRRVHGKMCQTVRTRHLPTRDFER